MMIERRPLPDPLPEELEQLPEVLRRVYAARGVTRREQLDTSARNLLDYGALGGIDAAAGILEAAVRSNRSILIVGDYDADGATSTALVVRTLRAMGAGRVDYLVPNRFEFGYGLSPAIVEVALERSPEVLITVDNGIASIEGVAAAKAAGVQVIVTDHHLPGAELPIADAIVNPNCEGDAFPSKALAGVGVAFYLMAALRARLRDSGWFESPDHREPNLAECLDIVALGTVADVVPLDQNNRVLVSQGLARIRAGRCAPGITALMEVGKRDASRAVASDLGFVAGPRLNAAGRLDDMTVGIECLLAPTLAAARPLAQELQDLNEARKQIEADMSAAAETALERLSLDGDLPAGLCLFEEDWHPGVVGIVASRVKERCHRPVIAFAPEDERYVKGSARSVEGVHIKDVLERITARDPTLVVRFGGHAMAAGLTLERTALAAFGAAFHAAVAEVTGEQGLARVLASDGPLEPAERTLETAEILRSAGPWGQRFPEPVFDDEFEVADQRIVGGRHLRLSLECARSGHRYQAIAFGMGAMAPLAHQVRALYRLDVNTFGGRTSLQLMVEHLEPA